MDVWTNIISTLGLGGAAMYLLWDQNRRHSEQAEKQDKLHAEQLDNREKKFEEYTRATNEEMRKITVETTLAHREATKAIEKSTDVIREMSNIMSDLRHHLIKHDKE